jgi:hypothetical protein
MYVRVERKGSWTMTLHLQHELDGCEFAVVWTFINYVWLVLSIVR